MSKLEIGEVLIDDVDVLVSLMEISELKRFDNLSESVLYVLERYSAKCAKELEKASLAVDRATSKYKQ